MIDKCLESISHVYAICQNQPKSAKIGQNGEIQCFTQKKGVAHNSVTSIISNVTDLRTCSVF